MQEIVNLRKQLSSQQQDRDALYTRMQNVQKQNDVRLCFVIALGVICYIIKFTTEHVWARTHDL